MTTCGLPLFQKFYAFLKDDSWPTILSDSLNNENVPTLFGISFGECSTVCGSLGITEITNLDTLSVPETLGTQDMTLEFAMCGLTDNAILRVPIRADIQMNLVLRASGKNTYWPQIQDSEGPQIFNDALASLTGEIIFSVPIVKNSLQFSLLSSSIKSGVRTISEAADSHSLITSGDMPPGPAIP